MWLHAWVYFQRAVTILLKPNNLKEAFKRCKGISTNKNRQLNTKHSRKRSQEFGRGDRRTQICCISYQSQHNNNSAGSILPAKRQLSLRSQWLLTSLFLWVASLQSRCPLPPPGAPTSSCVGSIPGEIHSSISPPELSLPPEYPWHSLAQRHARGMGGVSSHCIYSWSYLVKLYTAWAWPSFTVTGCGCI